MNAWLVVAIVVGVCLMDGVILVALLSGLKKTAFGPLSERYPALPPGEDAVTRRFQSFRIGMYSLGFSIHVTADETHLHLNPAGFWRRLGAGPSSIPWSQIEVVRRSRRGNWTTVRIGGHPLRISGPPWCLDLADAGGEPGNTG
ncbi:MAG: hypothetical protein GY715_14415 [Planctomycetes bacterium]|nr:hypothetical protein [Planctomycetota bacterium]